MSIQYSDNMSPEDQQKLLAECAATERKYEEAAEMDAANAAQYPGEDE